VTWTLFLALGAYGLALLGVGPCLTSIAATYRIELGAAGAAFTAFFVGFTTGVLTAGPTAERFGKRRVTSAGLVILTAGLWMFGASPGPFGAPHFWWALASMFVMGVGGATVESTASAMAADVNPGREAFAINLMQAFFSVGAVAAPIIVAVVIDRGWGWQMHFRIAGGVTAALFVMLITRSARENPPEPLRLRELAELLRSRAVLGLGLTMFLYVGSEMGYTGWVSALVQTELGAGVALAGQSVTAFWLGMTVGRLICTWLLHFTTARRLMFVVAAGGAVASGLTALAPSPAWGIAAAGVVGLFFSGAFGLVLTLASERFTQRRAAVFSLIITCVGIGGMTLPAVMGLIGHVTGLRIAMLAPAAAMALIALLFVRRGRN
jgi:FHS family glucose/mannose:H+ symporter-like MFS transporter